MCADTIPRSLPLVSAYILFAFRRVRKQATAIVPGLLKSTFLVEGLRTYYIFSLWTDDAAIVDFGGRVTSHVPSANWAVVQVYRKDLQRPELWSAQFRLWAVSHNLNWEGLDILGALAQQTRVIFDGEHR